MTQTIIPAEVFPPGEYLRDELDERGWTVSEFAQILGRPVQAISEILNGKKEITPETAVEFSVALDTSAELWLNLQSAYQLHEVRGERKLSTVARRSHLRSIAPIAELRRRGWISDTDDVDALERDVMTLFDIDDIGEPLGLAYAARGSRPGATLDMPQRTWLAFVRHKASEMDLPPFDKTKLSELAKGLPRMVRDGPSGLLKLGPQLQLCGVALIVEPGLSGRKLDGAVIFTPDGNPAIGITTRYDRFDGFVFTLLHEIAHITRGHVSAVSEPVVDEDLRETDAVSSIEIEANEQASDWIFPDGFRRPSGAVSVSTIARIADTYGVHPSIVIGRLQRDEVIEWSRFRNHIPKVRPHLGVKAKTT